MKDKATDVGGWIFDGEQNVADVERMTYAVYLDGKIVGLFASSALAERVENLLRQEAETVAAVHHVLAIAAARR